MLSCYRRDDTHNPEIYSAAIAAIMGEYSEHVVAYVTDPRTGLPSRQKFLPNVAEVREALDARAADLDRAATYTQRVAEQTRLTLEWLNKKPSEQLEAKGKAWLDRVDKAAQELSGRLPTRVYSEEEKTAFVESAKQAGREIRKVKLSDEAKDLLRAQDQRLDSGV